LGSEVAPKAKTKSRVHSGVRMRLLARSRSGIVLLSFVAGAFLAGCPGNHRARNPQGHIERSTAPQLQVSDDGFAAAGHDLLVTDPSTGERNLRLAGVEARQMARAQVRFRAREVDRGVQAAQGGLFLLRPGELKADALGPMGTDSLKAAVKELSRRGDEG